MRCSLYGLLPIPYMGLLVFLFWRDNICATLHSFVETLLYLCFMHKTLPLSNRHLSTHAALFKLWHGLLLQGVELLLFLTYGWNVSMVVFHM